MGSLFNVSKYKTKKWLSPDAIISLESLESLESGKDRENSKGKRVLRSSLKQGEDAAANTKPDKIKKKNKKEKSQEKKVKQNEKARKNDGPKPVEVDEIEEGPSIRIGTEFQADIPDLLPKYSDERFLSAVRDPENYDQLCWTPTKKVDEETGAKYLSLARNRFNCPAEDALNVLFFNGCDFVAAVNDLDVPFKPWTNFRKEEQEAFEDAYCVYGKDFSEIKRHKSHHMPHRTKEEIISYYYLWKAKHPLSLEWSSNLVNVNVNLNDSPEEIPESDPLALN